ncbi:MAG: alpha-amylase family glycosyl hydrolase, partial [Eubacteriales bacterium]
MLIRLHELTCPGNPVIEKLLCSPDCPGGKDVSRLGAFRVSERLAFRVRIPRRLGISRVILRIQKDGSFSREDILLEFCGSNLGLDTYGTEISLRLLCEGEVDGLFFYELLFYRGEEILYTDTPNNVDFRLSPCSKNRFRLLVYRDDFKTPAWLGSKIIYHIFVDRFRRGKGNVSLREGVVIDEDWEHGVPQYGERPGDDVENNVFFGGNLWGVIEKLDYIASLGAGAIYLSPIFEAYSNHKYDTGDYERVDGLFGGDKALDKL